jgi:hypothetical protein
MTDWIIGFITNGLSAHLDSILTAIGGVVLVVVAFFSGKKAERQQGTINTQKEIINAHEDRRTAEGIVRGAPAPGKSGSVRNKYQRD